MENWDVKTSTVRSLACLTFAVAGAAMAATAAAPVTVGAIAGGLLSGVAGNVLHDIFKENESKLVTGVFRRKPGIDENHHVIIALRKAHLDALGDVARRYAEAQERLPRRERDAGGEWFSDQLGRFLKEAGPGRPLRCGALQQLERDVFTPLPVAFDAALAARGTGPQSAAKDASAGFRREAETAVLAELRAQIGARDGEVPPLFLSLFGSDDDGWFALFVRQGAAGLKENAEFRAIWMAEKVAGIDRVVTQMERALTAGFEQVGAKMDQQTTILLAAIEKLYLDPRSFRKAAASDSLEADRAPATGEAVARPQDSPPVSKRDLTGGDNIGDVITEARRRLSSTGASAALEVLDNAFEVELNRIRASRRVSNKRREVAFTIKMTSAEIRREANRIESAICDLHSALILRPRSPNIWYEIGDLYFSRGNTKEAKSCYRNGVDSLSEDN